MKNKKKNRDADERLSAKQIEAMKGQLKAHAQRKLDRASGEKKPDLLHTFIDERFCNGCDNAVGKMPPRQAHEPSILCAVLKRRIPVDKALYHSIPRAEDCPGNTKTIPTPTD